MAAASHSSAGRGWRRSARPDEIASKKTKTLGRAVFTLLSLGLLALLVWWLWWLFFSRQTHLACVTVEQYHPATIAPIPFGEEDVHALSAPSPLGNEEVRSLHSLQTAGSLQTLWAQVDARGGDVIVLYINAQGVSSDGSAYLLGTDFLTRPESGRIKLDELLAETARLPGKLKLLILNVSHVSSDPRLGMLVNQFPRLLATAVEEVQDPSLWVLAANGPLETSRVSYSGGLSAFGFYVSEGLHGRADRNLDSQVDLDELADYVGNGVLDWVDKTSGGRTAQAPMLLRGGKGSVPSSEGRDVFVLVPAVVPDEDPEEAQGENENQEKSEQSGQPAPAERKKIEELLLRAWQRRDQMLRRGNGASENVAEGSNGNWAAVDYAPHLCREFQARLLAYDQRSRCGRAFWEKLPGELEDLLLDRGPSSIEARLADARRRFERDVLPGYQRGGGKYSAYVRAVQLKNELVFSAPSYVRWHAAGVMDSKAGHRYASYQPIVSLLNELSKLTDSLEAFRRDFLSDKPGGADPAEALERLDERSRRLAGVWQNLQKDGVEQNARELAAGPNTKGNAEKITDLLSAAVLPAQSRLELIRAVDELDQPLQAEVSPDEYKRPADAVPWTLLRDQARLEVMLVGLADGQAETELDEILARLPADTPQSGQEPWAEYRALGKRLGEFYAGLPDRIKRQWSKLSAGESSVEADSGGAEALGRLLRGVDGRDAAGLEEAVSAAAILPMPAAVAPAELTVGGPPLIVLDRDEPKRLDISLSLPGRSQQAVSVRLGFKADELQVQAFGQRQALPSGRWIETAPDSRGRLSFSIRPAEGTEFETASLAVSVKAAGQSGEYAVQLRLPPPDRVELFVEQVTDRGRRVEVDHHLRPFPNRQTEFYLGLKSSSARAKTVTVQLLAAPQSQEGAAARASEAWPLDDAGRPRGGYTALTEPVEVELLPGGTLVPVPFAKDAAKDKEKSKDAAPATAPAAAKTANTKESDKPAEVDVTAGMVLVIVDKAKPSRRWSHRLRFTPRAPGDYVQASAAYDRARRQLEIELKTRDTKLLPQLPPDGKPIRIVWPTRIESEMRDKGQLISPSDLARLFATVEPGPRTVVPVRLDVDGYPRAFIYDVKCDRSVTADRITNMAEIKITDPLPDAVFQASRTTIPLKFRADAPTDAFKITAAADSGEKVQVWIDADGNGRYDADESGRTFGADRQIGIRLQELRLGGLMNVRADVSDFEIELPTGGLKNKRVDVVGQLLLPGRDPTRRRVTSVVPIVLDGLPPTFREMRIDERVASGEELSVTVDAADLGGVDTVEAAFDLNESQSMEKEDKPKKLRLGSGGVWAGSLDTKDMQPGLCMVVVRATDRVGNVKIATSRVEITKKPDPAEEAAKQPPTTGDVAGRVFLQDQNCGGMTVRLVETGQTAGTDSAGRFEFKDIPAGTYNLSVNGPWKNMIRQGTAQVVVEGGKTATAAIALQ